MEPIYDPMTNSAYQSMLKQAPGYGDPALVKEWMALYYALIEEIDIKVGEILNVLDSDENVSNNTLVIFTSDHGEMLGAHAKRDKNNFYEEASRVPLLMRYPAMIPSETIVEEMVGHIDLFATILDYVGASKADSSDGKSLRPFIEGLEYNKDYDEDVVFGEWDFRKPLQKDSPSLDRVIDDRPCFLVRKGKDKLMMQKLASSSKLDMLFDLDADPFEMNNLLGANSETASDSVIQKAEHLRCLLIDWMTRLNGQKGYFSDPAANYGQGEGDITEVRQRQKWGQIGFWISDNVLYFGKPSRDPDGSFIRHEHIHMGTRKAEVVNIVSVAITGMDATLFSVDNTTMQLIQNHCQSIKVTFLGPSNFTEQTQLEAFLEIQVAGPMPSLVSVRLAVNNFVGPPTVYPSSLPSGAPSMLPSSTASASPSQFPTNLPSSLPSEVSLSPAETLSKLSVTWKALDYSSAFELTPDSYGGCNNGGDGVDSQPTSDEICKLRDLSPCNIGWWDSGEYLLYSFPPFQFLPASSYSVRVRAAAFSVGKDIAVSLIDRKSGSEIGSKSFLVPAFGYQEFTDLIWKGVALENKAYDLKILSNSGKINFCSVAILPSLEKEEEPGSEEPDTIPSGLMVPGIYNAMMYEDDFYELSAERFGNCPAVKPSSPVDAKLLTDAVCKEAIAESETYCNIGWTEPGEYVWYNLQKEAEQLVVSVSVRIAAKRKKRFRVELHHQSHAENDAPTMLLYSNDMETPGSGSWDFYDTLLVWQDIFVGGVELLRLKVTFLDGQTNLCAISVA
ncbi:MAG: hypothetical protein SGILL_001573 [Bacillariaceae sp.]